MATDTIYADIPAVDDGATQAQVFFGTKTTVTDVYGMKTDKQFVNTLEDNIHERGAMNSLLSDSVQVEISNKVKQFYVILSSVAGKVSLINNNRIRLNVASRHSNVSPILSWIVQVHLPSRGYYASCLSLIFSTIPTITL
jgi:hypothetical protein